MDKNIKIRKALESAGISTEIKQFPDSTRTSLEAAEAIGCEIAQIAKSIIFKSASGKAVLVIASGSNRVDTKKVENLIGEEIGKADADFVLEKTGFIIGGVPPVGHITLITPIIDEDLLQYAEVWTSAGTPHSVFKIKLEELVKITKGKTADVKLTA